MSRITSETRTLEVQEYMNSASGTEKWKGITAASWRLLIVRLVYLSSLLPWSSLTKIATQRARNEFVKDQLTTIGVTEKELRQLMDIQRYRLVARLEEAFIASFFDYSRDHDWMQDAVGENRDWIMVNGMAAWHIRAALIDLKRGYSVCPCS